MSDFPPGWYPDGSGDLRYWDGGQWTEHVHQAVTSVDTAQEPPDKRSAEFDDSLGEPRGRGLRLMILLILSLAIAGGGLWYGLTYFGVLGDDSDDTTAPSSSSTPAEPNLGPDDDEEPDVSPEPEPSFTCWDGSSSPGRGDCPPVRGEDGARWLFPRLDRDLGTACSVAAEGGRKLAVYGCTYRLEGVAVRVVYSEWDTYDHAEAHYLRKYGEASHHEPTLRVFGPSAVNQSYQMSHMFADEIPFSVTVASRDESVTRKARSLFEVRPRAELKGPH